MKKVLEEFEGGFVIARNEAIYAIQQVLFVNYKVSRINHHLSLIIYKQPHYTIHRLLRSSQRRNHYKE